MKKNKKTYVDIEEISYNRRYRVSFITTYDVTFLGKYIKSKTETSEVPFLFNSLDVAKDFCEVNPKICHTYMVEGDSDERRVFYETYQLVVNNRKYYVRWEDYSIKTDDSYNMSFDILPHPVVNSFVDDVILPSWMHTYGLQSVDFHNEREKLSELVSMHTYNTNVANKNKHWKFELVENEEAKS